MTYGTNGTAQFTLSWSKVTAVEADATRNAMMSYEFTQNSSLSADIVANGARSRVGENGVEEAQRITDPASQDVMFADIVPHGKVTASDACKTSSGGGAFNISACVVLQNNTGRNAWIGNPSLERADPLTLLPRHGSGPMRRSNGKPTLSTFSTAPKAVPAST
ncbi:hypothetical protein [Streptomyces hesseae]|uniref:Uncharacterized protein n=1 Tax=Streptomyces hesseae TaxID=3075519 RepID=A0ABU2T1E4_9ACTN|nr:hypothetical protein [Streptomyces sp. DSM 40473]MDT0454020.1 hypothetical protein [Streptomyces sp. DSM 40473]